MKLTRSHHTCLQQTPTPWSVHKEEERKYKRPRRTPKLFRKRLLFVRAYQTSTLSIAAVPRIVVQIAWCIFIHGAYPSISRRLSSNKGTRAESELTPSVHFSGTGESDEAAEEEWTPQSSNNPNLHQRRMGTAFQNKGNFLC